MSFTDEDKQWIASAIGGAISDSEARLSAKIERVETSLLSSQERLNANGSGGAQYRTGRHWPS